MKVDFYNEVLKRKDELIEKTVELLQINSELTEFNPNSKTPFGEGIDEALNYMLNLAKKDGFKTLNADGYAGHIELGEGEEYIGIAGHLDVVPAGSGWDYPAYAAKIVDGKIYARGALDDKGPCMAAYYAMKIIKELKLPLKKRIKFILGTDEETGWRGIRYYFDKFPAQPSFGIIPDSDFPLTYAEKGIVNVKVSTKVDDKNGLIKFSSGLVANMVPEAACAVLSDVSLKNKYLKYLKKHNYEGTAEVVDDKLHLSIKGKSAHGSLPEKGINAAYLLIEFFNEVDLNNDFIDLVNTYLLNDLEGKKIGVDHFDEETGSVTINAGVFKTIDDIFEIELNIRHPNGVSYDEFIKKIKNAFNSLGATVTVGKYQKALYVDPNSKEIQTLLNVYKKHTNDLDAKPLTTGGGTYARAMANSVAFGPTFPGKPSYIHQKNEYIEIEDLLKMTVIYAESLYEVAK